VDESALAVHEIELVAKSAPCFSNGSGVGEHATVFDVSLKSYIEHIGKNLHSPVNLGQIAVRHKLRRLVADTDLETSWAPINELNSPLGLDAGNGGVNLLGNNVTTIQETCSHVLAVAGIALNHLVVGLEAGVGDLLDRVGLMRGPGCRDDRGV
jgi:hypothetical protein